MAVAFCAPLAFGQKESLGAGDEYRDTFRIVWQTVNDYYFDSNFGGLDWNAVRLRYEPRALAAKTEQEYYQVLEDMLAELGASHFAILPPEAAAEAQHEIDQGGTAGLAVHLVDGHMLVTRVADGSPAAQAGIRPGFEIVRAGKDDIPAILQRLRTTRGRESMVPAMAARAVLGRLDGQAATDASAVFLDADGREQTLTWKRVERTGELAPAFGNLPPMRTEFESRLLPDSVGYVRFNIFLMPVMDKVRQAIETYRDSRGLIIDLRGNPGGLAIMASGMAGLLVDKQISLGHGEMRQGVLNLAVFPVPKPVATPLAILVDSGSMSTSEIMAAGLQEAGRAIVVGEKTPGAALPSMIVKLPTGALFQFAHSDFHTPGGRRIEANGVVPDIAVNLDRDSLLAGRDRQLEAAVEAVLHAKTGKESGSTHD